MGYQRKTKSTSEWHKLIAENRGEDWREKIAEGKRQAASLPSALRIARKAQGLAQQKVAAVLEISISHYAAVESGRQPLKIESVNKIARFLKKPANSLFARRENKFIAKLQK